MRVKFVSKQEVAPGVVTFTFEPEKLVKWTPGFYWKLTLQHDNPDDRGTERWFTISAAPFEKLPAITTRMDGQPRSSFKNALDRLKPGDVLEADEPEGDFVVNDLAAGYVFLAGGIGITPFRSMLVQWDHDRKLPAEVNLIYANRSEEAPFQEEMEELAAKYDEFTITYLVEPDHLTPESIKQFVPDLTAPVFYASGPEPMVEALEQEMTTELGIPKERLKTDFFPGYTKI